MSKKFKVPKKSLRNLDAQAAGELIAAAADVTLLVDRKGIIRDVAFGSTDLEKEVGGDWQGMAWEDTVTVESRGKVAAMLEDALGNAEPRWRQVNHPSVGGPDVPILVAREAPARAQRDRGESTQRTDEAHDGSHGADGTTIAFSGEASIEAQHR